MNAIVLPLGALVAVTFYALCWYVGNKNLASGRRGGVWGDDWVEIYVLFPFWGALCAGFVVLGVGTLLAGGVALAAAVLGVKL